MSKTTTLITGAGKRIGAAMARHLAAAGHDLVLHYHSSKAEAEALAAELRAGGAVVTLVQADLSDIGSLSGFWKGLPPVSNIIHNASRYVRDGFADFSAADLQAHMAVNFTAPLVLSQGFVNQLPKGQAGNIVLLGDDAARWSLSPHFFTYAVSKHSWRAVVDLLAAAVSPQVRANVIALAPSLPGASDGAAMFARLAEQAPLKRTGGVDEVLSALDFVLASPGLTGQIIGLGNGMSLLTKRD